MELDADRYAVVVVDRPDEIGGSIHQAADRLGGAAGSIDHRIAGDQERGDDVEPIGRVVDVGHRIDADATRVIRIDHLDDAVSGAAGDRGIEVDGASARHGGGAGVEKLNADRIRVAVVDIGEIPPAVDQAADAAAAVVDVFHRVAVAQAGQIADVDGVGRAVDGGTGVERALRHQRMVVFRIGQRSEVERVGAAQCIGPGRMQP